MMRSEVTVAQYRACVNAGACSAPNCTDANVSSGVIVCNWSQNRETHPVNFVSWTQMREFGAWVGADLPTEAQWEFAARSRGQEITYPWGNTEPDCSYADFVHNNANCGGSGTVERITHADHRLPTEVVREDSSFSSLRQVERALLRSRPASSPSGPVVPTFPVLVPR